MATYYNSQIKKYREQFGYTQAQIADMLDVDTSQISRYESGENYPSPDKLVKMASVYHISIEELLGVEKTVSREQKYTEDGIAILDIKNAQVARRQFFSKANDTAVTIYPDGIKYSTNCIRKWEDTDYIQITVIEKYRMIVVRKSNEDDIDSQRWCKKSNGKRYSRKITGREFSTRIYRMMNWLSGYTHRISGYPAVNEDNPDEELWYFELDEAEASPMSQSAREKCGVKSSDIDEKTLELLNEIEKEKEKEREERRIKINEGKNPGPLKQYIFYPDKWGQYTFGLPVEIHGIIPKVDLNKGDT